MIKILVNFSIFLYILLLFNREFVPLIDLRMIALPIFIILLSIKIILFLQTRKLKLFATKEVVNYFILFIFLIIISNLSWTINIFRPNEEVMINTFILYLYNFLAILIVSLYSKEIKINYFKYFILFSGLMLFLSMLVQFSGMHDLPFAGSTKRVIEDELSLLGTRIGGYAEDQNYATFSMMIWLLVTSILFKNKILILSIFLLSFIGIVLSFSKTIILATFILLSWIIAKKLKLLLPFLFISTTIILISITYIYDYFQTLSTMSIRFRMWESAIELFLQSPIFGSGTTSVRSYFFHNTGWYVQPHSSFLALLADTGIIAFYLYIRFFLLGFKLNNIYYQFLVGLLLFFSFTYELFVFQYPYFVLGILPIIVLLKQNKLHITTIRI